MKRTFIPAAVALAAFLFAPVAFATTIAISYDDPANPGSIGQGISLNEGDAGEVIQNPDGTQTWRGEYSLFDFGDFQWDFLLDADPFVSGTIGVVNNTDAAGTFTFEVGIPVTVSLPAGTAMSGSSSITINDSNLNGAASVSAPAGGAIYQGRINGTPVATLFDDPYSLSPSFPPTTTSDNASFSGATASVLNVGDVMSIQHTFVLSARDGATGNSNFVIIPEPASFVLIALGGIAALVMSRRRSRIC